jgi:hypothetical protein
MRKLRVGVLDIIEIPTRAFWPRVMNANLAGIMPQVVSAWCERAGHRVFYSCFTGFGDPIRELPDDLDLLFIGAYTAAAQFAYALSYLFRRRGVVTVLGGPHARCYPEDAARFFDYVVGFTDRAVIEEILHECAPQGPVGRHLSAAGQPRELVPLAERWKFVEAAIVKAPTVKFVGMLGSMGCPYACSFCIDSTVQYRPLSFVQLSEDLRFLHRSMPRAVVAWHDPSFGVRFDEFLDAVEDGVPPGRMRQVAECPLSLLTEPHVARLERNGFRALLPGVESWFAAGDKLRTRQTGLDKVREVADQARMIARHIPYVRANFLFGLDADQGSEPFELTKRFLDLAPEVFAAYSLLTAYGRAVPLNLDYQRAGRVLPFPFQFLDSHQAMNVRPKHYAWPEFYDRVVDLSRYAFSSRSVARRFVRGRDPARWIKLAEVLSWSRQTRYHARIRRLLDTDAALRRFMDGESDQLPEFYRARLKRQLGPLYGALPAGALTHDHLAYLHGTNERAGFPEAVCGPGGVRQPPAP